MSLLWTAGTAVLGDVDVAFARTLARHWPDAEPLALRAAALASWAVQQGHTCLDLDRLEDDPALRAELESDERIGSIDADALLRAARAAPFVSAPGSLLPLVFEERRLYLRRYHEYECDVGQRLRALAQDADDALARATPRAGSVNASNQLDPEQARACELALRSRLTVLCGGPGTGKTYTVVRLLAALASAAGDAPLRIGLAAPTGKAATRLSASLARGLAQLALDPAAAARLDVPARTLHRLLGMGPQSTRPRHGERRPLALDVLVVDEASMVDLPLFAKLLRALPPHCRLVLVGDPEQLPAVEGGAVLGALASLDAPHARAPAAAPAASARQLSLELGSPPAASPLGARIVRLRRTHRFGRETGLARLVEAVRAGDVRAVRSALEQDGEVRWIDATVGQQRATFEAVLKVSRPQSAAADAGAALSAHERFRVLSALRAGPAGVEGINAVIEQALGIRRGDHGWYRARPLLVVANDYELGLYNGDAGIVWPDPAHEGALRAWFEIAGELRSFAPGQLPAHETGYAMTVHKAQGSEFDEVVLALPREPHALLTREWLYTAVSRARSRLTVFAPFAVIEQALARRQRVMSGLSDRLSAPS